MRILRAQKCRISEIAFTRQFISDNFSEVYVYEIIDGRRRVRRYFHGGGCAELSDFMKSNGLMCTESDLTPIDETFSQTFDVTDPDDTFEAAQHCATNITNSSIWPDITPDKTKSFSKGIRFHEISCPGVANIDKTAPSALLSYKISKDGKKATISITNFQVNIGDSVDGGWVQIKTGYAYDNKVPAYEAQRYRDEAQQWISTLAECIRTRDFGKYH